MGYDHGWIWIGPIVVAKYSPLFFFREIRLRYKGIAEQATFSPEF